MRRELERDLPFDVVAKLDAAGFGALRARREHGGPEVSIEVFTRLLVDLMETNSYVAHLYRSHAGFVETLRFQPQVVRDHWFPIQVLEGATVGNASTERGGKVLGTLNTVLTRTPEGGILNGEEYYTTGSIFSDYTQVSVSADGQPDGSGSVIVSVAGKGDRLPEGHRGAASRRCGRTAARSDSYETRQRRDQTMARLDAEAGEACGLRRSVPNAVGVSNVWQWG